MENKIVMLSVDALVAHPKNPRKNVGDVTELAESIKKSGIMQNLTVIPKEDEEERYTVIIGHRRLAAAKMAGLNELPCVIKEMTPAEQLATMLAENVQRNDLTPLEQAEGIQMMFDIGESVSDVVAKTGLSESTVRRRAKMLEMDIDTLRDTENRGATLADYEKLAQIEDIEERNEVLKSIGTNNFNYKLESALARQHREKNKKSVHALLDTFAKKATSYPPNSVHVASYTYEKDDIKIKIPKDADTEKYVYYPSGYSANLYKIKSRQKEKTVDKEAEREAAAAREREEERKQKLCELAEQAYKLRRAFVDSFNPSTRHGKEIKRFLWNMLVFCGGEWVDLDDVDDICGTAFSENSEEYADLSAMADEYFENNTEKAMLQMAYLLASDDKHSYINSWRGEWCDSERTDKLYECLERLGYRMSDDEKALQDGSHELFKKGE